MDGNKFHVGKSDDNYCSVLRGSILPARLGSKMSWFKKGDELMAVSKTAWPSGKNGATVVVSDNGEKLAIDNLCISIIIFQNGYSNVSFKEEG